MAVWHATFRGFRAWAALRGFGVSVWRLIICPLGRMGLAVHLLELFDGDPRIHLSSVEFLMPQHRLDMADIRAIV
ncbi:hypothetical protein, partial [Xenorhabdus sp. TS4]|uniref:hypothetical protein n=1 Tax=Xenorhabdus sp. TS4 TaxID=1873483 RepID=UPI001CA396DE